MSINSIFMRFPGGLSKALTLSYDDGVEEDVRLIEIMKQNGLCGTFNLNSGRLMTAEEYNKTPRDYGKRLALKQAAELYGVDGIEPALHTYSHTHLNTLPPAQVAYEVMKDREQLETLFGRVIRGMAYPYGTYSDETVEVLRNCGILYSRTVIYTEDFKIPTDWLRLPATCHHKNAHLPELTQKFIEKVHKTNEQPWLFYLWGHAYEFERDHNWEVIERFAEQIGGREDIWYATNGGIFEYIEAFQHLIFTADMMRVQNPTAKELWFFLRGQLYKIAAGETLKLD